MTITTLALVAPGDTITSAQQNIVRTDIGVLDSRTGGDPGAAGKIAVSDGAASTAWTTAGTAVTNGLGYTPLKNTTDSLTGDLTVTATLHAADISLSGGLGAAGSIVATGGINGGNYGGGSTSTGTVSLKGLVVGTDGVAIGSAGTGPLTVAGSVTPGSYAGGSTSSGAPSVLGLNVGTSGIASTGAVNPASYTGGSTSIGSPSVLGLNVGTSGIASTGPVNPASYTGGSTSTGTPSFHGALVGSDGIVITGGTMTVYAGEQVYSPSNPPPLGSGAAVPSGLLAYFRTAAGIASGWARYTAADGRYIVAAGTSGIGSAPTFAEDANAGSTTSYAHAHTSNSLTVNFTSVHATGGVGDVTGNNIGAGSRGGTGSSTADDPHHHSLNGVSLVVSGTATATGDTASSTWLPPAYSLVLAKKT